METFILWIGFIGAWLLFAGPICQAALELQDEDIEIDRIRATGAKVPKPKHVSAWLLFIFPVKLYLDFKRDEEHKRKVAKLLSREDLEAISSFGSKARAWMYVALGGLCIALKETYELAEHLEWSWFVLVAVVVGMFVLSVLNLRLMLHRADIMLKD